MRELRLEKRLFDANQSLQEVQPLAENIARALQEEKEARLKADAEVVHLTEELERLSAHNAETRVQADLYARELQALESKVHRAEQALSRSKMDSRGVVEA